MLLDQIQSMGTPPLHTMSVPDARQLMESMNVLIGAGEEVQHVEDRELPGPAGPIPTRLYRPAGDGPLPLLVYFHGGGWVLGGLASHDDVCRSLANGAGCAVLAIDYRLAPEHRFPAAVDDCYAATVWAVGQRRGAGLRSEADRRRRRQRRRKPRRGDLPARARPRRPCAALPAPRLSGHRRGVRHRVVPRERHRLLPRAGRHALVLRPLPRRALRIAPTRVSRRCVRAICAACRRRW